MSDDPEGGFIGPDERAKWLEGGGYVSAADGLSGKNQELAGPDFPLESCLKAIDAGAKAEALPAEALERVGGADAFITVQLLLEIYAAASSEGMSDPEWSRLREAAGAILGAAKCDAFLKLCALEAEAATLRHSLVFGD